MSLVLAQSPRRRGLSVRLALIASVASSVALAQQPSAAPPARRPLAIVHATILTMKDSTPIRDGTVLIDGTHITRVGPGASVPVPRGARVIDATGKFVIPGLWDMHAHTAIPMGESMVPLYIANGVTGVRDMGGDFAMIKRFRARIRDGALVGPRIIASGPYVQGGDAALPHMVARTPAEAKAAIDTLARMGVDFVKVHYGVPRPAFFALAREARAKHLVFAGHSSLGVTVEESADSGQRSLEHLDGFLNTCSRADSLRLSKAQPIVRLVLMDCGAGDQSAVYRHIARDRTWVTPTFVALEMAAALPSEKLPSDTLAHYEPAALREMMAAALEIPKDMPRDANVIGRALFAKRLETVRGLVASGVPILAGTDAPLPNSIPGFGLHTELAHLVRAGLSPYRALAAATSEASRYFASDTIGTICANCSADLVVLDADPLRDIANTKRIALVVADGRVYDAAARQAMREAAIRAATPSATPGKPRR